MSKRERDILERAVAAVAEQAAKADALIDDLLAAGLPEDGPGPPGQAHPAGAAES